MFHLVCVSWLVFRAQSVEQIINMLQNIFFNFVLDSITIKYFVNILFFSLLLVIVQTMKEIKGDMLLVFRFPGWVRGTLYLIIFTLILVAGVPGGKEFIYFQF